MAVFIEPASGDLAVFVETPAPTEVAIFIDTPAAGTGSGTQGPPGEDGASAYEVAVANGFVGNETAWLASLIGPAGADGVDGQDGADGTNGADGQDGASAFDIAVANGFVGDETAWLASLQGLPGNDGADGINGNDGSDGADGAPGADGQDGASAYDIAVANGFVGDETDWLASLVGPAGADGTDGINGTDGTDGADGAPGADGQDGASAYQVAVANGFVGDETAWLASLVGPAGADGADGADGATGPEGPAGADAAPEYFKRLGSNNDPVTSTSLVDVTGLSFSGALNKSYRFEFHPRWSSNISTEGPTFSISAGNAATSLDFSGEIWRSAIGAGVTDYGTSSDSTTLSQSTGSTAGRSGFIRGLVCFGSSGNTDVKLRLATETGGSNGITILAGSWMIWREVQVPP